MATTTRLLLATALLTASGVFAFASDHLASPEAVQGRLSGTSSARAADLSRVEGALSSPQAARAAASFGVDVRQVRSAVATLSDAELRDLAERAAALDRDPRAGLSHDVDQLLVIFLIVAIVILVIKAID
jgi:Flp pilus assembly protein TadB